jgi:hypothetical protein
MQAPTATDQPASRQWIEQRLTAHKAEIQARGIRVVCEFESPFQIVESAAVHAAGKRLFQFVFSTVPDGCEVFIAAARKIASVAALESGSLTLRWQTTGNEGRVDRGSVAPLRPIPGNAAAHAESAAAQALGLAFRDAGWDFELRALNAGRELWLRVSTP